jgi:hypothetical protein
MRLQLDKGVPERAAAVYAIAAGSSTSRRTIKAVKGLNVTFVQLKQVECALPTGILAR